MSRQLNSEQKKKASLLEDKIQYKKQTSEQEIRLQKLQKLAAVLERVNLTISEQNTDEEEEEEAAKKDEITVDSVISLIETLFDNFPEEFTIFGLMNLIPELLSRTADLTPVTCGQWRPLDNPRLLIHICESWEPLVKFFERRGERALASHTASSFQTTIEKVCLPVIRRSFSNDWKVLDPTQAEAAVSLLEALKVVFPSGQGPLWEQMVDMLIMPRLVSAVTDWQPLRDRPAHLWLLPWLPVLTSKLSAVYPELRRKMGVALTHWQPASLALEGCDPTRSAPFALNLLMPWRGIFDNSSFESLILRHVVPKLVTALRDGLQISPSGQDITPFQCVMLWQHSLPPLHLSCLFAGEFFPKWIQTLSAWLHSPAADFSEIGEWYSGWKSMFAGTPLEEDETILGYFNLALEMMQSVLAYEPEEGQADQDPLAQYASVLKTISNNNYLKLVEQKKSQLRNEEKQRRERENANIASARFESAVTFKEVVEAFAERNNIEFLPKVGKSHEGKQLWQFGNCICFMDNNVLFTNSAVGGINGVNGRKRGLSGQSAAAEKWVPVDLEELLAMAQ